MSKIRVNDHGGRMTHVIPLMDKGVSHISLRRLKKSFCASRHRAKIRRTILASHFKIPFVPREIGRRRRRRPISLGTASIFEMAREDGTPCFGPVPRGTKEFCQFSQKHVTPLTSYSTDCSFVQGSGIIWNRHENVFFTAPLSAREWRMYS